MKKINIKKELKKNYFKAFAKIDIWFAETKLSLEIICRLIAYFVILRAP